MAGYIGKGQSVAFSGKELKFRYTAAAAQTTFTASYAVGYVNVFLNGVRLIDGDDYTATTGTQIVLTAAANEGDSVVIVSSSAFDVADAWTKGELPNHNQMVVSETGTVTAPAFEGDGSGLTGIDGLPAQTSQAGKYLTTDGSTASWETVDAGAKAGAFFENDVVISTSYAITAGKNAMTAGPVTIADGVTVTIPDGSTWTII